MVTYTFAHEQDWDDGGLTGEQWDRLAEIGRSAEADHDPEPCSYVLHRRTLWDPPEFCENDQMPGSEFCSAHQPHEQDWDDVRKNGLYG